ncbi:MAG TPA: M20/M25/M40 family metallo-hydrolase [Bryobacteraceae bacterium]|nr:M20/M25/M40 family metallo-hydrolase [Bryobacteraceae bacterium]
MMAANHLTSAVPVGDVAQLRGVRECLQWFTREKQWINEEHLEICRIAAPTFLEQPRAQWMAAELSRFGWRSQIDRAGNVVAFAGEKSRGPYVALAAHLDTVLAPRAKEEITVGPDGKFYGPGVSDNGSGLAALLAVARAMQSSPGMENWAAQPLLIGSVGEEGEGNLTGMRWLCKSELASEIATFLVLDGASTDHITTRALGSRRFEVTFNGPGGHSWSDYGVGNPVHALSRAVALFSETRLNGGPRSSYNVGLIDGGTSINSIPSLARAKVDIRSESNEVMNELVGLLNGAVERAQEQENQRSAGGKVAGKVREIGSRPAAELKEQAPVLHYIRAVDAYLGIRSHLDCSSTDANIPLSLGIPAVAIGAGGHGGGAHTLKEWYNPEGRDLGLKRIYLTLSLLLRDPQIGRNAG